jgi:hypothetical protein
MKKPSLSKLTERRLVCALFAASLLLAGCARTPEAPARLGLRLPPSALGATINVQQHLAVERPGGSNDLDVALEADPTHVKMVGLAFGQRVLSLDYDGKLLNEWRHPMLPAQVRGADVLEDLQLTLWPLDAIAPALPSGWRIADSGLRRTIYRDGAVVATIDYSAAPRWSGTVVLNNLRYDYRLTIQTAP